MKKVEKKKIKEQKKIYKKAKKSDDPEIQSLVAQVKEIRKPMKIYLIIGVVLFICFFPLLGLVFLIIFQLLGRRKIKPRQNELDVLFDSMKERLPPAT